VNYILKDKIYNQDKALFYKRYLLSIAYCRGEAISVISYLQGSASYQDKISLFKAIANKNQLVTFATLCAESVLYIFEKKYPKDKRVRECIEYLQGIKDYSILSQVELEEIKKHRDAAYAAADAANAADAAYAYAAYAAYDAANAAADAAYAYAAYAAADAAYAYAAYAAYAAAKRKLQEELNVQFMAKVLKEVV
jgi:uncharacterized protein YpiB (UPF0302 family)